MEFWKLMTGAIAASAAVSSGSWTCAALFSAKKQMRLVFWNLRILQLDPAGIHFFQISVCSEGGWMVEDRESQPKNGRPECRRHVRRAAQHAGLTGHA